MSKPPTFCAWRGFANSHVCQDLLIKRIHNLTRRLPIDRIAACQPGPGRSFIPSNDQMRPVYEVRQRLKRAKHVRITCDEPHMPAVKVVTKVSQILL